MSDESKKTVFRKVVVTEEMKKKFLVGNTPPFLGKPFELNSNEVFTIGREDGRTLQLPSEMVSRLHASIELKDGKCVLTDNDSSNGTFLNSEQIPANAGHILNHRDIVKFDTFEFIFIDTAVGDLWQTLKPLSREGSQIVSFYSPKGGTGISTIVVNLARTLCEKGEKKVAVVDLDLRFGDILTYLVGKPGATISELIREQEITPDNIQNFMHKGPGFDYLVAPKKTELAELVTAQHIKTILWSLEAKYDYVLVDLKTDIDDVTITAWEASNLIYLVAMPEIGHLLAARKVIEIMNTFKFPETKFKVIMNKVGREGTVSAEEAKSFLKKDVFALPYCPDDAVLTSNGGKLLVSEKPGSNLTQAINNLSRNIAGEQSEAVSGGIFSKLKSILGF
ncbi:MAG TPA: FHA domain-containing protein [Candidatus Rifleibacterium sp.]|nr:FHA domain-containing protein [Candidatus Rifleibacterium sp.]HPT44569.1 FHA domain-containing protein [Candidatus Rifleibacterium sp.]